MDRDRTLTPLPDQAANIPRKLAPTIGISVDPRRQNLSEESLSANVARLKDYQSRLILFPRRNGKNKKGDASAEEIKAVKAGKVDTFSEPNSGIKDVNKEAKQVREGKLADHKGEEKAYRKLRDARSDARLVGVREKRSKLKAEQAEAQKK